MKKFGEYPIYINYNHDLQALAWSGDIDLHEAKQYEKERQSFIKTTTTSDLALGNRNRRQQLELDIFENSVYRCLEKIRGNPVGKMILGLINKQTKVWIVPRLDLTGKDCSCAQTGPLNYEIQKDGSYARGSGFGDTVITFRTNLGDDTLLHELVHAYRFSTNKFKQIRMTLRTPWIVSNQDSEEFFAHQMETIYLAQASRPMELDYHDETVSTTKEIYVFLLANFEAIAALKLFSITNTWLCLLLIVSLLTTIPSETTQCSKRSSSRTILIQRFPNWVR